MTIVGNIYLLKSTSTAVPRQRHYVIDVVTGQCRRVFLQEFVWAPPHSPGKNGCGGNALNDFLWFLFGSSISVFQ